MNPTHVIIKLDPPVGPDDAQHLAEHIVSQLAFADVEWACPAYSDGWHRCVTVGEKVVHA